MSKYSVVTNTVKCFHHTALPSGFKVCASSTHSKIQFHLEKNKNKKCRVDATSKDVFLKITVGFDGADLDTSTVSLTFRMFDMGAEDLTLWNMLNTNFLFDFS